MNIHEAVERPPLVMIAAEADALADIALRLQDRHPNVGRLLLEEIDRADTRDTAADVPDDVVTMGSTVEFQDEKSGERHVVELVYPKDADIGAGRLSILTPVGAGLIGLRTGQAISWPDRTGKERLLTIARVKRPG
jgi:regulator of nucleoside diphosphate kinase